MMSRLSCIRMIAMLLVQQENRLDVDNFMVGWWIRNKAGLTDDGGRTDQFNCRQSRSKYLGQGRVLGSAAG